MRKSVNDPFAQAARREELGLPKRRDMLDAVKEHEERYARKKQYMEDTIAILGKQNDNQTLEDLRLLMNEARERLIYYNEGKVR